MTISRLCDFRTTKTIRQNRSSRNQRGNCIFDTVRKFRNFCETLHRSKITRERYRIFRGNNIFPASLLLYLKRAIDDGQPRRADRKSGLALSIEKISGISDRKYAEIPLVMKLVWLVTLFTYFVIRASERSRQLFHFFPHRVSGFYALFSSFSALRSWIASGYDLYGTKKDLSMKCMIRAMKYQDETRQDVATLVRGFATSAQISDI